MPLELYLAFVAATVVLILTPGPMVALIVANSVAHGLRSGLLTVAGSSAAMALHLVAVCAGLASLLAAAGGAFFWLKWLGAAYLLYLGLRTIFTCPSRLDADAPPAKSDRRTLIEAFLVALSNPKVLIFYAAFFPLFIAADRPLAPQLFILSATFLGVAAVLDCGWALTATKARPFLARAGRWGNRLTGGVLILAAAGLAAARKA